MIIILYLLIGIIVAARWIVDGKMTNPLFDLLAAVLVVLFWPVVLLGMGVDRL